MKKYINIIKMSGTLHCCPGIYDTREEADNALKEVVCNYRTPHMQTVTKPIEIEYEEE